MIKHNCIYFVKFMPNSLYKECHQLYERTNDYPGGKIIDSFKNKNDAIKAYELLILNEENSTDD